MTSQKPSQPSAEPARVADIQTLGSITIDDFYTDLVEELTQAEQLVRQKETELAQAREQVAGARRALRLLGDMQRAATARQQPGGGS